MIIIMIRLEEIYNSEPENNINNNNNQNKKEYEHNSNNNFKMYYQKKFALIHFSYKVWVYISCINNRYIYTVLYKIVIINYTGSH